MRLVFSFTGNTTQAIAVWSGVTLFRVQSMQRKYGIQVWILLTETNEIVKSALQTIRCKEKIRFFRGHQEKTGASEDEKNSILKGKPRIPPIVSSWCVHGRNKLGYNRLGLTVSAKLACAVKRNRIKRLFREAYRLNEDKFADGIDLVLVARVRAVGASYQEIEKSLLRALKDNKVAAART